MRELEIQIRHAVNDEFVERFNAMFSASKLSKVDPKFLCIKIIEMFSERYFFAEDKENHRYILPTQRELGI